MRARAGLGRVGEDRQPVVCGEVQPVEAEVQFADGGVVKLLDACAVEADVVCGPEDAELVALGSELTD